MCALCVVQAAPVTKAPLVHVHLLAAQAPRKAPPTMCQPVAQEEHSTPSFVQSAPVAGFPKAQVQT